MLYTFGRFLRDCFLTADCSFIICLASNAFINIERVKSQCNKCSQ